MKQLYLFSFCLLTLTFSQAATEKYRLSITDDPSTTMTIGWNQISGHSVAVFYDVVDHGTDFMAYSELHLPDRSVVHKGMNNYFARLTNLQPNTAYYFVIADSEGVSERFWFRTLPNTPNTPLSIVAGGDSRRSGSEITPHEPRIQSNEVVRAIRPDFVAFGGDYTDKNTDGQWQTWFDDWQYTTGDDGLMIPILATRGNHERSNDDVVNLFDVRQDDVYYAIDFGGSLIRFYTLNVMISVAGAQTGWLAQDLMENDATTAWKMAQYHYATAPHQSGKSYKTAQYIHWAPLFYQHNMQLVIECDSHVAKNTWPIRPTDETGNDAGFIRDDETGTVYSGEGSWGLIRSANVEYDWTRDKGSFTQVKWIHASLDSLVVYTIKSATSTPVGTVDDANRFEFPEGLDLWETENGDRIMIDRVNPNYDPVTSTVEQTKPQIRLVRSLFPNPAQTEIKVVFHQSDQYNYQVFDIKGQIVTQGTWRADINTLNITDLSNGHYYLKVWQADASQFQVKSFIKN